MSHYSLLSIKNSTFALAPSIQLHFSFPQPEHGKSWYIRTSLINEAPILVTINMLLRFGTSFYITLTMSRLRRLDRAILTEAADITPLDSEDQEQLIVQLANYNDTSLRLFLKVLVGSILLEIPVSVFAMKHSVGGTRPVALLIVCHVLTLVNCLYDFKQPSETAAAGSLCAYLLTFDGPRFRSLVFVSTHIFSFYGILVLNTVVLIQLLCRVYAAHRFQALDMLLVLPVVNLVAVALIRKWYRDVSQEILGLHGLKYKFKTA
ncbi:hypothetical protein METBIDRAFT_99350 [Metschnikowia bicuspidata var. bicuspidata NRRL YB-4993]|uniref:Uncharacterized protein n=1 Tax=Metschnikowia bicuspidata var. bicuspidata NRRL YB-4993 TaxID=869754 RepID=A0A1A0HGJ7_9ASCO|nr:hypothetical protein METBIDRAFT_99350 [Metschnikowia bicuspidata var. bicuspidata NRRL YB-4993]OBA23126.1 hypothetical protein METBIDRAFT_99350 [Metschnikowia bicuspidata var. bicuspidata NRRL YB-4993]